MQHRAARLPRVTARPESALVCELRAKLRAAGDPARAPHMQAYMKSALPFLGVGVPEVRRLTRASADRHPGAELDTLRSDVHALWDDPTYREERYAATALCDTRSARAVRSPELLPLYRDLIVSGAWWDHVDELARRVGELRTTWPDEVTPELRRWARADDIWLRRAAIICQLGARRGTDLELLRSAIQASAAEGEFFLRKAIGWALRDYARTDPAWVGRFVAEHDLSRLSRREALRHLSCW